MYVFSSSAVISEQCRIPCPAPAFWSGKTEWMLSSYSHVFFLLQHKLSLKMLTVLDWREYGEFTVILKFLFPWFEESEGEICSIWLQDMETNPVWDEDIES